MIRNRDRADRGSDDLVKMQANAANVVMPTITYDNQRYSTLNQITAQNVGKLQVAWTFSTGVLRGHEGAPLVIGDVMYVHAPFPNTVFALDLNNDGKILWKYEPKQDPNVIPVMCCDTVNRGLAYADGKLFLHQADTTPGGARREDRQGGVVGEDRRPRQGRDRHRRADGRQGQGLCRRLGRRVRRARLGHRLLDGGRQADLARLCPRAPDSDMLVDPQKTTELGKPIGADSSLKSWEGDQWKIGGGATWGWYSYDPKLNLIYYGSGNPSTWNPKQRPGDNKWSMTIFARDADTGMAKWVYQMTPHDQWDYDGVNEMILADQQIGGQTVPTLVHFDRNGLGYTLNRATGELLVAAKYDPAVNWTTGVDMNKSSATYGRPNVVAKYAPGETGEDVNSKGICPAALGSKDEQPAAYSPETKLFYVPTNHVCMDYEPFRVSYTAGQPYVGATLAMYPPPGQTNMGNFIAWDATKGKIVWSDSGAVLGLVGRARDQGRRGVLRHAGGLSEGGRRQDRQGTLQVQDPVRHHRQRDDL